MQERIFDFIVAFIESNGYSPSYREIASAVGLRSASTVLHHLEALASKGLIGYRRRTPRSIHIKSRDRSIA